MTLPCKCNRNWTHCTECGSKNFYVMMQESEIASVRAGRKINAYRCRRCTTQFDDDSECHAKAKGYTPNAIVLETKEPKYWEIKPKSIEEAVVLGKRLEADGKSPQEVAAIMKTLYTDVQDDTNEQAGSVGVKMPEPPVNGPLLPNGIALDIGKSDPIQTFTLDDLIQHVTRDEEVEAVRPEVKKLVQGKP